MKSLPFLLAVFGPLPAASVNAIVGQESHQRSLIDIPIGPFNKSGKSKSGKSKSVKEMGDKKSQKPFAKSSKSEKSTKKPAIVNNNGTTAHYKVFHKSSKKNTVSKQSDGSKSQAIFDKSGKSSKSKGSKGKSSKGSKGKSTKSAGSKSVGPFPKSGKSKSTSAVNTSITTSNLSDTKPPATLAQETIQSRPTIQPTCNSKTVRDDFNMCIAIDGSGSVCGGVGGIDCLNCSPSMWCKDTGYDDDTCCRNFGTMREFASEVVSSFDDFPVQKEFSIVQFATDAVVQSELAPINETLNAIDELSYSGGFTNHEAAIKTCQQTLASSSIFDTGTQGRKSFILLVTDGVSTYPRQNPQGKAEEAATLAKDEGITIIPIFITAETTTINNIDSWTFNSEDALPFMTSLSSDDKVFNVEDFDSLNSIQESLVNQVSCY